MSILYHRHKSHEISISALGFGKREVGGAQPYFGLRTEHLFGKEEQRLFQVGKCNVLVDVESFDLMEKSSVREPRWLRCDIRVPGR